MDQQGTGDSVLDMATGVVPLADAWFGVVSAVSRGDQMPMFGFEASRVGECSP